MTTLTPEMLKNLLEPFDPEIVQWKPGATTQDKTRALALAYADSRAYYDRLDAIAGADWSDDYQVSPDGRRVVCRLTIAGVTRCDVGESDDSDQNTTTSAAAQAFKRACAKFGLGRYLYSIPQTWVDYDAQRRAFTPGALSKLKALAGGSSKPVATDNPTRRNGNGHSSNGVFPSPGAAIAWAMDQGAFDAKKHAQNAYKKLKDERQPTTAGEMAELWRADVAQRLAEKS